MMDTSTPNGFYHQYRDHLIRLVFRDGREWTGIVTGVAGSNRLTQDPRSATAVVFTRFVLKGDYYEKVAFFRGRKKRFVPDEVAEIHQLPWRLRKA
jgi:hypothetical protein